MVAGPEMVHVVAMLEEAEMVLTGEQEEIGAVAVGAGVTIGGIQEVPERVYPAGQE